MFYAILRLRICVEIVYVCCAFSVFRDWYSNLGIPRLRGTYTCMKKGAGLLQGSRSSVVRASTAKVGGLGFDSQWLPMHFFFNPDLPPVAYHQFLLPVVVDQYSYKNNHVHGHVVVFLHALVNTLLCVHFTTLFILTYVELPF